MKCAYCGEASTILHDVSDLSLCPDCTYSELALSHAVNPVTDLPESCPWCKGDLRPGGLFVRSKAKLHFGEATRCEPCGIIFVQTEEVGVVALRVMGVLGGKS